MLFRFLALKKVVFPKVGLKVAGKINQDTLKALRAGTP